MREIITDKLKEIEEQYGVKILFAAEAGSRAWGFASPDSDYDVRFIYAHKTEHYLSINEPSDVIELPVNEVLDINGWDLKKALQLFRKSNAPVYEWLQSPVIYRSESDFVKQLNDLMPEYFSLKTGLYHYYNMARNCFETDLQGEQIRLKKYFYALRPLLAARWIIDKRQVPPMEFKTLFNIVSEIKTQKAINELLEIKSDAGRRQQVQPVKVLQDFIEDELAYCAQNTSITGDHSNNIEKLNNVFRTFII